MSEILVALKDTPIPTILVIGGLVFLFLSMNGQFSTKAKIPPHRQRFSAILGIILLLSGIFLYVIPALTAETVIPLPTSTSTLVPPTLTNTFTPSPTPSDTSTLTLTPIPECRFNNLLNCSVRVPFPQENFSASNLIDGKLFLNFNNQQLGSGLALQFKPPLNVQGFKSLEVVSTSTQGFNFEVEYKVDNGSGLQKVETSAHQSFPIATIPITFSIPITYDGEIDEIVINFFGISESSNLIIDTIRLK